MDKVFLILVILLTAIGLLTLLSASFPYAEKKYDDPLYLFIRQAIFAGIGFVAMSFVGKINYQRFRGIPRILLYIAILLLILASFLPSKPDTTNGLICCGLLVIGLIRSSFRQTN